MTTLTPNLGINDMARKAAVKIYNECIDGSNPRIELFDEEMAAIHIMKVVRTAMEVQQETDAKLCDDENIGYDGDYPTGFDFANAIRSQPVGGEK